MFMNCSLTFSILPNAVTLEFRWSSLLTPYRYRFAERGSPHLAQRPPWSRSLHVEFPARRSPQTLPSTQHKGRGPIRDWGRLVGRPYKGHGAQIGLRFKTHAKQLGKGRAQTLAI
jgi:hypothetical protein